jgi:imidazolonepropionase
MTSILIKNISQLVTLSKGEIPRKGNQMKDVGYIDNACVLIEDGKIAYTGGTKSCPRKADLTIDAGWSCVTPGLVDPHTHPVFAATREEEFVMRIMGKTYMEIASEGGGIMSSVRSLRNVEKDVLKIETRKRLNDFLKYGTTTIEAKSGYGLTLEDEIKSLEIISELNDEQPLEMIPTFLGAHSIPEEYKNNREEFLRIVIEEMLPEVADRKLTKYCDIFCEKGVFTVEESRRVLQKAKELGLKIRIHSDEFEPIGGTELAGELKASSADHLTAVTESGMKSMLKGGVVPIVLPATTFFLGHKEYSPARKMIDMGLPLAMATDFNPGSSMTNSLPMAMTIACINMKLLPEEALTACTVNSAYSLDLSDRIGSLKEGMDADLVIWDTTNFRQVVYHFGVNHARVVLKKGRVAWER